MKHRLPNSLRRDVADRACFRCEYCLVQEEDLFLPFEVDHIISRKHGGGNEFGNLAFACPHCNQYKGSDLTTFLDAYDDIVSLFNPRKDIWSEHFSVSEGEIIPLTRIGAATVKLLQFNGPERLLHRQILMRSGHYP